ncbi:hypothetical protein AAII07_37425 [Microvirga sp. 0TCS3.31]
MIEQPERPKSKFGSVSFTFPQPNTDYYRELIRWYEQVSSTMSLRLALANNGDTAVHDLHLDTRFTADPDGSRLAIDAPERPQKSNDLILRSPLDVNMYKLENLAPNRWALEHEVGVVQVGRTLEWGPHLYWQVSRSASLVATATAYSSDAPPFTLETQISVNVQSVEMTYQQILERLGVPEPGGS